MRAIGVSDTLIDAGALIGRLLLGAIFVWAGLGKAFAPSATIAGFTSMGLAMPALAYAVAVIVEVGVGLLFVLGLFTRATALILAVWCIATAVTAHSNVGDNNALIQFFKNAAMCGGFIYAALLGAGGYSADAVMAGRRNG